ncbi:Acetyltransferase (GNAT) family protein [Salinihabitans flavidus]|uniref:Acetyltransferase (GNAT) family protein n=2 Tax=Salinihabitans flavidus TaxID=569882 RepID=A0A1H8PVV8_9RHOB|nr:GNAT family N-acetyltransferase [Salinihabitans flavidus]SEO46090.1 Acetyltransferase (GNAT) family protein [Salinihabitans flavidus]
MSTALHLAKPGDLGRLLPLIAAHHAEQGVEQSDEARADALCPLLDESPHGVAYLIGPARAPVGYVIVTFGWSLAFGGLDGTVEELYIRPAVRRRGMGSDLLHALPRALGGAGLRALHFDVDRGNASAQRLGTRAGFTAHEGTMRMTRRL